MSMLSAEKIIIAERVPYAVGSDYTLIPPALFRALVDGEFTISYDEVYLDVDTVPEDLLAIALVCFDSERVFVYSRRWEEKLARSGSHGKFFESLETYCVSKGGDDISLGLIFRCANGRAMERSRLFRRKLFRSGQFGCKYFFPGITGMAPAELKVERRLPVSVLHEDRRESGFIESSRS